MEEQITVAPGDPDKVYTCIWGDERPFASHCWIRAAAHVRAMDGFNYFERQEAAERCEKMGEAAAKESRTPQRIVPVKGFSWGDFKTIKPIR